MKHVSCAVCKGVGNPKVAPEMAKTKGTDVNSKHEDPNWPQTYCGCVQVPSSLCPSVSLLAKVGVIEDQMVSPTT